MEGQKSHFSRSAGEDMDIDGQNKNGEDAEEEDGMDDNGLAVGGEASELHHAGVSRQLKEQPRWEENEEQ